MNSEPASSRAKTIARPIERAESWFSSASIEMPSKPRKDSTAIETAPKTTPHEKVWLLKIGAKLKPWPLPWARATMPTTRKIARTMSSPTSITLLTLAVISMPR